MSFFSSKKGTNAFDQFYNAMRVPLEVESGDIYYIEIILFHHCKFESDLGG
jgi:hypothetical protein